MESSHFDEKIFIPNPKYIYKFLPVYAQDLAIEVKDGKINDGANIQLGESKNVPHQFFKILHILLLVNGFNIYLTLNLIFIVF